jgi:cellulose synthase/poly-beta-1,6-N-acetylglucosamine synthase-like glycosyltransferase
MWSSLLVYLLVALYLLTLGLVALYGLHRYILLYLYLKHRHNTYKPVGEFDELPKVTIQLPMFNEGTVAERIIRATCLIDYPLDKLEIQVLDDSTDASREICQRCCEEWAAKGYPIRHIHRANRVGYKAGALAAGLKQATGKFVAIFDADFIPPRDILRNVVHYFTDRQVGMVQVRWDHLNRDASLLTRSQAIFLDGHFMIEHTARNRSGRFMHFNGTAGIWRRSTIDDAGGWEHDTLTEDLDLSYRAQMKGWKFVYLPQFCAPAELPPEMVAFKQQAHRWTKGSVQTAIKLLPKILRSRHLPWRIKTEAFFHLTNTVVYPLMVMVTVLMWPTFFNMASPFKDNDGVSRVVFSISLFVLATCSASTFFVFGQRELFGPKTGWKTILHLPFLMGLGVGICVNNAKAVVEACWSAFRKKPSEFVRTPKYGVTGARRHSDAIAQSATYFAGEIAGSASLADGGPIRAETIDHPPRRKNFLTFNRLMLPIVEIAFGIYMSCCIFISLYYKWGRASVPFLLIFAGGYLYVGVNTLLALYKMQMRQDDPVVAQAAEPAST